MHSVVAGSFQQLGGFKGELQQGGQCLELGGRLAEARVAAKTSNGEWNA